eukprot:Rmarinus@m.7741
MSTDDTDTTLKTGENNQDVQSTPPGFYRVDSAAGSEDSMGVDDGVRRTHRESSDADGLEARVGRKLNDINFYVKQDTFVATNDLEAESEIMEAEEVIRALPVLSYEVVKISNGFIRLKRTLKLTSEGICNVKNDGVSSRYPYRSVKRVALRGPTCLVISYEEASHDYVYESPVAVQAAQEISIRLALHRNTEKKREQLDSLRFQQKMQESVCFRKHRSSTIQSVDSLSSTPRDSKSKLAKITGSSEQERVEMAVDQLLADQGQDVGRTVAQFIKNAPSVMQVRPEAASSNVRNFITGLKKYVLQAKGEEFGRLLMEHPSEDEVATALGRVLEERLEVAVVLPLEEMCLSCIRKAYKEKDNTIAKKIEKLALKPQSFFGIQKKHESATNWSTAIVEMSYLDKTSGPSGKLRAILSSANAIYTSYQYECAMRDGDVSTRHFLGADDFLPIHIYVVVQSGLQEPWSVREYIWQLCDPDELNGEKGYYLTVFNAALQYILDLKLDDASS